uniref:nitrogenase component 1 n=1 Tax=Coprococcus catus TaxID=116085 RepID=UPI0022E7858E|nr:nitrogenase component 1 [Coprococcus catus]
MRQAYRIIPIYTADVSGVCSALYELGGMTVMHDPSGCNSTYNTHDEIRWYDEDSLIFISGLTEIDAIMGNDEKFIYDIEEAASELKPRFIALASSPIPYMNGTDFPAIAEVTEQDTGIPTFAVPTNGMHDYVRGAGMALEAIAEHFVLPKSHAEDVSNKNTEEKGRNRLVNLLGVTPLDFGPLDHAETMKRSLEQYGWQINSMWAMGDSLDQLSKSADAAVNVVVSSVGLRAAKVLQRKFGTPYVVGAPVGRFTEKLSEAMEAAVSGEKGCTESEMGKNMQTGHSSETEAAQQPTDNVVYTACRMSAENLQDVNDAKESPSHRAEMTLIGEPVTMGSLAAAIELQYSRSVRVLCPLEETDGLMTPGDEAVCGEEMMEEKLKDAGIIAADPLYRPICPKDAQFFELPHIAFSGRIYLKKIKQMPGFADLI